MDGSSEVTSKDLETTWNSWLVISYHPAADSIPM